MSEPEELLNHGKLDATLRFMDRVIRVEYQPPLFCGGSSFILLDTGVGGRRTHSHEMPKARSLVISGSSFCSHLGQRFFQSKVELLWASTGLPYVSLDS